MAEKLGFVGTVAAVIAVITVFAGGTVQAQSVPFYGNWDQMGGNPALTCQMWWEFRPGKMRSGSRTTDFAWFPARYQLEGTTLTITYQTSGGPNVTHWRVLDADTLAYMQDNSLQDTSQHVQIAHRCK